MTSEYPYPGSNPGSDGSLQPDPYEPAPQQRPQYGPDGQLTPFDAFGGPAPQGEEPAPKAAARAAVRMPPGLVVSTPPAAEAGPPSQQPGRGAVYGGSPAIYGSPAPSEYGQPAPAQQPSQPQPAQRPEPATYGQPQAATYGQPSQPATYGQPSQPANYGQPSQPATYGQAANPATYGSPEPRVYGRPAAPVEDQAPEQVPPQRAAVPTVPQQRSSGVYGRPAAPPEAPPQDWPDPQPAAPAWPDQPPHSDQPAWQQQGGRPPEPPAQFEQHGRRTQGPGGYGGEAPAPRAIAWQDQLQPMTSTPAPMQPPPSRPMSSPASADVAVIPVEPRSKFRFVGYGVIVAIFVALGVAALWYTSRSDPPAVGTCVAQSGNVPVPAPCSQSGTFRVTKSVSDVSQCTDYLNQPSLSYTTGGKQTILCLEPAAGLPAAATPSGGASSTPPSTPAS